jgi:hypothetical protein
VPGSCGSVAVREAVRWSRCRILDEVNLSEAVLEPAVANVLDYVAAWNEPDAAHG